MTQRDAEAFNAELAKAGQHHLRFVPIEHTQGQMQTKGTPKIHFQSKTGESLMRAQPTPTAAMRGRTSSGVSGRRSGSSGSRKRSSASVAPAAPGEAGASDAPVGGAYIGPPSITQQRSKRPKMQMSRSASMSSTAGGAATETKTDLKPCAKLLRELLRHPKSFVFSHPVDPNVVPDYYNVITDAMDLGTVKKRLDNGMYQEHDEVFADLDKVWNNCLMYNGETSQISDSARELKALADKAQRDIELSAPASKDDSEQMKEMKKQMKMMQKQLQMQMQFMQNQSQIQQSAMPPPPPPLARRPSTKKAPATGSSMYPMVAAAETQMVETREMSFEEKQTLSGGINRLTSNNLSKVVKIIKQNMPSLGQDSEEIEVDLAALDNGTLWKLQQFVDSCAATKKRPKKSTPTPQSRQQQIQQAQIDAQRQLSNINSSLQSIDAARDDGYGGAGAGPMGGNPGAYSPSDSGSDVSAPDSDGLR